MQAYNLQKSKMLPESPVISYQNYETQMLPDPCEDVAIYTTAAKPWRLNISQH